MRLLADVVLWGRGVSHFLGKADSYAAQLGAAFLDFELCSKIFALVALGGCLLKYTFVRCSLLPHRCHKANTVLCPRYIICRPCGNVNFICENEAHADSFHRKRSPSLSEGGSKFKKAPSGEVLPQAALSFQENVKLARHAVTEGELV